MRRLIGPFVACLASGFLTMLGASPASAAGDGCDTNSNNVSVCVRVNNGTVYGDAYNITTNFTRVTVYVEQCRPTSPVSGCGTIAANSKPIPPYYIRTSSKPAPSGHIFRTCASWRDSTHPDLVFECSVWRSWP